MIQACRLPYCVGGRLHKDDLGHRGYGWSRQRHTLYVNADVKGRDGDSPGFTVTENENVSGLMVVQGDAYDSESADGRRLSDSYAGANNIAVGDKLTLSTKTLRLKVK